MSQAQKGSNTKVVEFAGNYPTFRKVVYVYCGDFSNHKLLEQSFSSIQHGSKGDAKSCTRAIMAGKAFQRAAVELKNAPRQRPRAKGAHKVFERQMRWQMQ